MTDGRGASYSPRTLILQSIQEVPVIPSSIHDRAATRNLSEGLLDYQRESGHEDYHWIQFNSTSFGAFFHLLRYSQELIIGGLFKDMAPELMLALIAERDRPDGRPIVETDTDGDPLPLDPPDRPREELGKAWARHFHMIKCMLGITKSNSHSYYNRADYFSATFIRLLDLASSMGLCNKASQSKNHLWFNPQRRHPFGMAHEQTDFTTDDILEGAAFVNEFLAYAGQGLLHDVLGMETSNQAMTYRIQKLFEHRYAVAFKMFLLKSIDYNTIDKICQHLPSLLMCYLFTCDLALNPPLPPVFLDDPDRLASWAWEDIYPPMRFLKIAEAMNELKMPIGVDTGHEVYSEVTEIICEAFNWPSPLGVSHPYERSKRYVDFGHDIDWNSLCESHSYFDYLLWVQSKFWKLRKDSLPLVVAYGKCWTGEESRLYADHLRGRRGTRRWFHAPLLWDVDDKLRVSSEGPELAYWVLYNNAFHEMTHELLVGNGYYEWEPFPYPKFPRGLVESEGFTSFLSDSFKKNYLMDWIGFLPAKD